MTRAKAKPELVALAPHLPDEQARKDALEMLANFKARIESGEIVSLAVAGCTRDGAITTAFTSSPRMATLLGALAHVTRRVSTALDGED